MPSSTGDCIIIHWTSDVEIKWKNIHYWILHVIPQFKQNLSNWIELIRVIESIRLIMLLQVLNLEKPDYLLTD